MHISPFYSQFFLNLSQLSHRLPCVSMVIPHIDLTFITRSGVFVLAFHAFMIDFP